MEMWPSWSPHTLQCVWREIQKGFTIVVLAFTRRYGAPTRSRIAPNDSGARGNHNSDTACKKVIEIDLFIDRDPCLFNVI